jgi:hypothetical protein
MRIAWAVFAAALLANFASGQTLRRPRYIGEIGHLNTEWDPRKSMDVGRAKIHKDDDSDAVIDGRDDAGKPWKFTLPLYAGVGWTDLWKGDFDGNSRPDLMIARMFPQNGRCVDGVILTFLMFDRVGRPVPFTIETHWRGNSAQGQVPALFVASPNHRRLDLVTTGCEYSEGLGVGEDRRITGIFEAEDAHWRLIRPANLDTYQTILRSQYSGKFVTLLKPDSAEWLDARESSRNARRDPRDSERSCA